ncbi:2-oxoglutarate and iron-dependent oxygenase domain-containing protein [Bordetella bronchialis]|uniref:2-oxoglutarate and iron-dependent oxygenase domain-containing protein n=1 Tax=Bordetella bronchialis TaxID=463025 RepID=UPI0009F45F80|nr:2-oxoglutarate and iron-dependent oxygenase domain-containing protein [Bordetella bronchialis]
MPQKYSTRRTKPSPRLRLNGNRRLRQQSHLPIVDISPLLRGEDLQAKHRALREICAAARDSGLFYLTGHEIPQALLRAVYLCSLRDFELAHEFKSGPATDSVGGRYTVARQTIFAGARIATEENLYPCAAGATAADGAARRCKALDEAARELGGASPAHIVERYYGEVFELCRALLVGCALARGEAADFFQCLYRHPVLHAPLLRGSPPADAQAAARNQPCGAVTVLWTQPGGETPPAGGGTLPAGERYRLRIGDTLARWFEDLHISAPHRVADGPGRESFLLPVFYGKGNPVRVDCANDCPFPRQTEQLSLVV